MLEVLEGMHWRNFSQRLRLKCNILHQCPLGSCSCPRWLNTPRLPQRAPGTKSTSIIINVHHIVKSTSLIICPDLIWSYLPTCSIHETLAPFSSAHKLLVKPCQVLQFSTNFQWFNNQWLAMVIGSIKIGKFRWYFWWWLIYPLLDHLSWHMSLQNKSHSYTRCIHYIFLTVHSLSKMILFASDSKKTCLKQESIIKSLYILLALQSSYIVMYICLIIILH